MLAVVRCIEFGNVGMHWLRSFNFQKHHGKDDLRVRFDDQANSYLYQVWECRNALVAVI